LTTCHRQFREHVAEFCRTELNLELDITVYEEHKRYKTCSEYDCEQKYQEMDNITHAIRQAQEEYIKLTEKNDELQQNTNELQNIQQEIQQTVDTLSQEENRLVFASWLIDNPDVLFAAQELAADTMRQEFVQYIGVNEEKLGDK
jgi:cell division septum initiation protein DivIVA